MERKRMVQIKWRDSYTLYGWHDADISIAPSEIVSVGILIDNSNGKMVTATSLSDSGNALGFVSIPSEAVTEVKTIGYVDIPGEHEAEQEPATRDAADDESGGCECTLHPTP